MLDQLILSIVELCSTGNPILLNCVMLPNHVLLVCVPDGTLHSGLAHFGMSVIRDYVSVQGESGVFLLSECRFT